MQLGRKLAEGFAVDTEDVPDAVPEQVERPVEVEQVEQPVRV